MKKLFVITVLFSLLFVAAGCGHAVENRLGHVDDAALDKFNQDMREEMDRNNAFSMKHYGVKIVNTVYADRKGGLVIDYTKDAFNILNKDITLEKQLDMAADLLLEGKKAFNSLGITHVVIMIDHEVVKRIELK